MAGDMQMVVGGHDATEHDMLAALFGKNPYDPQTPDEARSLVVWSGLFRVGYADPETYWRRVGVKHGADSTSFEPPFPPHWCGAFHLWCLHEAGLCDWPWVIDSGNDTWGYCWRLQLTNKPQPGDAAYFTKNQHHAIWVGDGRIVNGNGKGGEVTVTWVHNDHEPDAYYSIEQLVARFNDPGGMAA